MTLRVHVFFVMRDSGAVSLGVCACMLSLS